MSAATRPAHGSSLASSLPVVFGKPDELAPDRQVGFANAETGGQSPPCTVARLGGRMRLHAVSGMICGWL